MLTLLKKPMIKIRNLTLVIFLENQNIKAFLQKALFRIGLKKFVWLKKLKRCALDSVINDLNGEEIVGAFYKKELQKTNQKDFRVEKVIKREGDKLYVKWKDYDSSFLKID